MRKKFKYKRGDRILFVADDKSDPIRGIISDVDINDKIKPYFIKTVKGTEIFTNEFYIKKDIPHKKSKFHKGDNIFYYPSGEDGISQIATVEFPYTKYGDSICIRIKNTQEIKYVNEIYLKHDLTKNIYFNQNGTPISDYEISNYVDGLMNSNKNDFYISSHMVINEIRARIKENKININAVRVYVEDNLLEINSQGRLNKIYKPLEFYDDILDRLI